MLAFIIWAVVGLFLIGMGIYDLFTKKVAGFWANVEAEKVTDVKKYNRAVGTLFIVYGLVFILIGTPLLGSNQALVVISMVGVMLETIVTMAVYTSISNKYKAK